jgi:hypothetical protein
LTSSQVEKSSVAGTGESSKGTMLHQLQLHRQILFNLTTHYLEPLEGHFERLNYLAGLRDPSTGVYRHDRLSVVYGEEPVNEALAKCHEELFERLLELPLVRQEQELLTCMQARSEGKEAALRYFEDTIQSWIPPDAPSYLKELFCSNLHALHELVAQRSSKARLDM